MPVAVPPTGSKPKVLFIGESCGSEEHDKKIREIAEVHWIKGMDYEETIPVIEKTVKEHGPFAAFGVSEDRKIWLGAFSLYAHGRACLCSATSSR